LTVATALADLSDEPGSTDGLRRVIIFGSRAYRYRSLVKHRVLRLPRDVVVVCGGAPGPDKIAQNTASAAGMTVELHRANWRPDGTDKVDKRAGYTRNTLMASLGADLAIAFWDGQSRGTAHMMGEVKRFGIPLELWAWNGMLATTEEATLRLWRDRH
jgi:hypothetical protein